jgi:2-methylcitrate dehydratase PrpD
MTSVTQALTDFTVTTEFQQLPQDLVNHSKLVLLDTIGCALVGKTVSKGRIAVELASRLGGTPEGRIIGVGGKVSLSNAAFANGELMNALDWDPLPHTLPCTIPANLAAAEVQHASGRDLILSMALSAEIAARLDQVLPSSLQSRPHGYGSSVFSGVAGAGRLLNFAPEAMKNAFGIAGFFAPVPAMGKYEGGMRPIPMTKYASTGWVAQTALTAALLAELGYTGDTEILDGDRGFWHFFGGDEEKWDPILLTDGLGTSWRSGSPWHKPYPCEVIIGMAVPLLREILGGNDLAPDDVASVKLRSLPILANDLHTNTEIVSHIDAQFSVPYGLALAANRIEAGPAWQDESTMRDPKIKRFMEKVEVGVHSAERSTVSPAIGSIPLSVEVVAKGRQFTAESPVAPITEDEILAKFEKNAGATLPSSKAGKARRLLLELEDLEDVSVLLDCLAP